MSDSSVDSLPDLIRIDRPVLRVGRGAGADVRLAHPAVSRRHAEFRFDGVRVFVCDLGSRTGVRVNGARMSGPHLLREDDLVAFGPVVYQFKGTLLRRLDQPDGVLLEARDLEFRRGKRTVLSGASLTIPPNNFIGILGPSGAGKTTLLKGLTGLLPAAEGAVYYDGLDLAVHGDACRALAGYVPQEDIVYTSLTARENLDYALRLRVAGDLRPGERAAWVAGMLKRLGLEADADRPVAKVSGGQRKRVNVAIELLSRPRLLLLDEPISGLDPAAATRLMKLLHELARRGTTVVCTTHVLESLDLFDAIIVVAGGGLLGSGRPQNLLSHFKANSYAELYETLEKPQPARAAPPATLPPVRATAGAPKNAGTGFFSQVATQVVRSLHLIVRDRTLTAFLVGQPLLIGLLITLSQVKPFDTLNLFFTFAVIAAIWLGLNNTAREIVRDRAIYVRERRSVLNPESYLLAKVITYGGIGLVQLLLLVLWLRWFKLFPTKDNSSVMEHFHALSVVRWVLVLWVTYLSAMLLGLTISTLASTEEVAVAVLPLVVLPQLLLSAVASNTLFNRAGWFGKLDVMFQLNAEGRQQHTFAGWCLEVASLFTYSRPAMAFFLKPEFDDQKRTISPRWGAVIDWSHLLFLLAATATVFVAVFLYRERRWLERS